MADCIFGDASAVGIAAAQAVEADAPIRREQMNAEIHRLARENLQFAHAVLDHIESRRQYEAATARWRRDDSNDER